MDKVVRLRQLLTELLAKQKCTLKQLQAVLGHLNFACKVVSPGRAFCTRLARAMSGASAPHHYIRITRGMRDDIQVWLAFLGHFNGVSLWQSPLQLSKALQVRSDAAGSLGFGVLFGDWWCAQRWPDHWAQSGILRDLTFLEFFPIMAAVYIWKDQFSNKKVLFWCDNQAVVRVINRQTSRSERVMQLVRKFVLTCLLANITFSAKYVPDTDNGTADALSRFQEDRFHLLAPNANLHPDPFPADLWSLGNS